jgi:hypothetical protein
MRAALFQRLSLGVEFLDLTIQVGDLSEHRL